jgi:type I restriction enzyme S subunit
MAREGTTIGDYVTLQRGVTYKGNLVGKPGPALLGLGSIHPGGGFREGDYKTYGGECPPKLMLFPGDLFVSLKGATKDGKMIGSVARVPLSVTSGRLTQDTVKLEFRDSKREAASFLYWILRTPQYRDYCDGRAMGSAVVALSRDDFLAYSVPPITKTRLRIVEVLEALDDKIELNRRMNATLEAMARALFQSWFVFFDPVRAKLDGRQPAGLAAATAALFPAAFQDSVLGRIPKGWAAIPLYETARWVNGAAFRSEDFCDNGDGLPVIKIAELKDGIGPQTRWSQRQTEPDRMIDTGDLLYSWSGSPDTSLEAFLWSGGPGLLNQHIFKVITPCAAQKRFVYYLLHYLRPVLVETARNKQTTGLGHVTVADMRRLMVCLPNEAVLSAFDRNAAPIFERAFCNSIESRTLATLRDTLLPRLLSGELSAKNLQH